MPQVVLVPVVADGTEVVVGALGALPPNSENRLLAETRKETNIGASVEQKEIRSLAFFTERN